MTNRFSSLAEFVNLVKELPAADQEAASGAADRNAQLTKPAGSWASLRISLCGMRHGAEMRGPQSRRPKL